MARTVSTSSRPLLISEQIGAQIGAGDGAGGGLFDLDGALGGDAVRTTDPAANGLVRNADLSARFRNATQSCNRSVNRVHRLICQLSVADAATLNVQLQGLKCN